MLIEQTFSLPAAYRGGTYDAQVNFWQDTARSLPFDFTSWVVSITVTSTVTVIVPTFSVSGGAILFSLTATQTGSVPAEVQSVLITLTNGATVEFLARGSMPFIDP